ncbi:MAG: hypothetical protein QOG50_360 [Actinomycetota bacterium]|jgi:hypothetical protein|nr:hypothetical protein [Actinomycetota bacterium]
MTGGPMPYVMDVGPYISVLEDRLNTPTKRAAILASLRQGALVSDIAGLDSTNLDTPATPGKPASTAPQRVATLNTCWFGMTQNAAGGWDPQPQAFPTGFWNGYQGQPHEILRAALKRAIEVSLGIAHGAQWVDPNQAGPKEGGLRRAGKRIRKLFRPTRDWPIEISWVCQGPFFQCWVTWMKGPGGSGHVALTITTPAAKGLPLNAKITRPLPADPDYACPPLPNAYAAGRGVWVLGHEDYDVKTTWSTIGTPLGGIAVPTVEYRRKSLNVVCVAPTEWEAGVLAAGRPYMPPP